MITTPSTKCPICKTPAVVSNSGGDGLAVSCVRCTPFSLSGTVSQLLVNDPLDGQQAALAAGWLREHPNTRITNELLERMRNPNHPRATAKMMKLMQYLDGEIRRLGGSVTIALDDPTILGIAWAADPGEIEAHLNALEFSMNLLATVRSDGSATCTLNPVGVERLRREQRLRRGHGEMV